MPNEKLPTPLPGSRQRIPGVNRKMGTQRDFRNPNPGGQTKKVWMFFGKNGPLEIEVSA